jgi:hypothetical protein
MGIATKNLVASGNESLRGARLSANCDQVGTQAAEEATVSRRPARPILVPDPVNAWTRPVAAIEDSRKQTAVHLRCGHPSRSGRPY